MCKYKYCFDILRRMFISKVLLFMKAPDSFTLANIVIISFPKKPNLTSGYNFNTNHEMKEINY